MRSYVIDWKDLREHVFFLLELSASVGPDMIESEYDRQWALGEVNDQWYWRSVIVAQLNGFIINKIILN